MRKALSNTVRHYYTSSLLLTSLRASTYLYLQPPRRYFSTQTSNPSNFKSSIFLDIDDNTITLNEDQQVYK